MKFRRLLVPLLVMLPMLAILLGLGTWQVQRLQWKTALLAEIAAAEAAPPVPLGDNPRPWTKVSATGHFDHTRDAVLGLEVRGPILGGHLLVPLIRPDAPALLVDRGWVPLDRSGPIDHPQGEVTVQGFIRPGEGRNIFSATDDTAGRRFYSFDPPAIGAALGLPSVEPFGLVALASPQAPAMLPDPARQLPRPTNSHLGYAITWYGLALSLLGVFAVWARRRLKEP